MACNVVSLLVGMKSTQDPLCPAKRRAATVVKSRKNRVSFRCSQEKT